MGDKNSATEATSGKKTKLTKKLKSANLVVCKKLLNPQFLERASHLFPCSKQNR